MGTRISRTKRTGANHNEGGGLYAHPGVRAEASLANHKESGVKIQPDPEGKMSIERIFSIAVILCLLLVAGLTVRSAVATSAVISADRSYDEIEHGRGFAVQAVVADRSYDQLEHLRADRSWRQIEDRSYDGIERIRSTRRTATQAAELYALRLNRGG